jgi:hypothetical protein
MRTSLGCPLRLRVVVTLRVYKDDVCARYQNEDPLVRIEWRMNSGRVLML